MDRVITRLIALLTTNLTGRGINAFYNGLTAMPEVSLPSVVVRGVSMSSTRLDTHRNQESYTLEVIVIQDARSVMNENDTENTIERTVRKTFEERGADNEPLSNTIMSIVEKQFMYDETYNLRVSIDNIQFGVGINGTISGQFPSAFLGVATVNVVAVPHRIKTP